MIEKMLKTDQIMELANSLTAGNFPVLKEIGFTHKHKLLLWSLSLVVGGDCIMYIDVERFASECLMSEEETQQTINELAEMGFLLAEFESDYHEREPNVFEITILEWINSRNLTVKFGRYGMEPCEIESQ